MLADAVVARDLNAARKVFDTAFWEKVEFRPDGFHLLEAVKRGDRQMVSLLTSYGAGWSEDETKTARRATGEAEWKSVEGPLKNAGIRTNYSAFEQYPKSKLPELRWLLRERLDATRRLDARADSISRLLDVTASEALVAAVRARDMDMAKDILPYRSQKLGTGTPGDPLDLKREFDMVMDRDILGNGRQALALLDTFTKEGYAVKQITVSSLDMIRARDIVLQLHRRGLLDMDSPEARREVLDDWTHHRQRVDFGGFVHDMGEARYKEQDAAFREAARIFFTHKPATPSEADYYVRLHARRTADVPEALANAEKQLMELGFFDSPYFTNDHLRTLGAQGDAEGGLKEKFNGRIVGNIIRKDGLDLLLGTRKFEAVEQAVASGGYKPAASAVAQIVHALARDTKKDVVPERSVKLLKALVATGADFSMVDPVKYIGKHAPGIAKALLDCDAVPARRFIEGRMDFSQLMLLVPDGSRGYAHAEFACQVILEAADVKRFRPLRASSESYQKQFIHALVQARAKRAADSVALRKQPPKPPSNAPRP